MRWRGATFARALAAWLAGLALSAAAQPDVQARADELVLRGYEDADAALAQLQRIETTSPRERVAVLAARGLVAARFGRQAAAAEAEAALRLAAEAGAAADQAAAAAGAAIVRAHVHQHDARGDEAVAEARAALAAAERACDAAAACLTDWRWRAQLLLARDAAARGHAAGAREHAQAAVETARAAHDAMRTAWALATQAELAAEAGDHAAATPLLAQARREAPRQGDPEVLGRIALSSARAELARGEPDLARATLSRAIDAARRAGVRRVELAALIDASDVAARQRRHREVLDLVARALPLARAFGDRRNERVLKHNALLAWIGLGRLAEHRADLAAVLADARDSGAGARVQALREVGDALADAGHAREALELYHEEKSLADQLRASEREAALARLRARFDREAQQRAIDALGRDNALQAAELERRTLTQRLWAVAAAVLLLAGALVAALLARVRRANRELAASQEQLRLQSERDPLTGLANRRRFQAAMRERAAPEGLRGALLIIDIDHFKHVNDRQGHAAGDRVIVECARRLVETVRDGDLVVRWGGEEYLVYAPGVAGEALEQLAARLLRAIGERPVAVGQTGLAITVSIGYAAFPLAPHGVGLPWERAVNLVDMALYTAKRLGRNRAVAITAVAVQAPEAVRAVEQDFEQAWEDGRVQLTITPGPQAAGG